MCLLQSCTNKDYATLEGFREWTHEHMSQTKVGNNLSTISMGLDRQTVLQQHAVFIKDA